MGLLFLGTFPSFEKIIFKDTLNYVNHIFILIFITQSNSFNLGYLFVDNLFYMTTNEYYIMPTYKYCKNQSGSK